MSSVLTNEDTLPPDDTFKKMELLCNEISRPKIFLNDLPIDTTVGGVESDPTKKLHNISFLSTFDNSLTTTSVQVYKSYAKRDTRDTIYSTYVEADTKSSAYFSDTSNFLCKSHDDGYEFQKFDSVLESSMNSSGYYGSEYHGYKLRDTLEECSYRRKSTELNLKEPSTPKKRTFSPQKLDIYEHDSVGLSSMSGKFSYSTNKSADAVVDLDGMQMMEELESAMNDLVTSSPIHIGDINAASNSDEPVDLNNTLERVNHILAKGGYKSPSPTRMVRRKRLMKKYVSDLLQRESFKQINNACKKPEKFFPTPKSRKPIKRTISVDESLKMWQMNASKALH